MGSSWTRLEWPPVPGGNSPWGTQGFPDCCRPSLELFGTWGLALNLPFSQIPSAHSLFVFCPAGPMWDLSPSRGQLPTVESLLETLCGPLPVPELEKLYFCFFYFPTLVKWISTPELYSLWIAGPLRAHYKATRSLPGKRYTLLICDIEDPLRKRVRPIPDPWSGRRALPPSASVAGARHKEAAVPTAQRARTSWFMSSHISFSFS